MASTKNKFPIPTELEPTDTCETCEHRMNEECGIYGHEVYDTDSCDDYSEAEEDD